MKDNEHCFAATTIGVVVAVRTDAMQWEPTATAAAGMIGTVEGKLMSATLRCWLQQQNMEDEEVMLLSVAAMSWSLNCNAQHDLARCRP